MSDLGALISAAGAVIGSSIGGAQQIASCASDGAICTGANFNPIAAAYQTQGMYVQANVIEMFTNSHSFGSFAALIFLLAAIGGIIGVGLGAPPKTYLWFFMGPALFNWLIGTTVQSHGSEWQVAGQASGQDQVWKLAEVGLLNTTYIISNGITVSMDAPPSQPAEVSYLFDWYDSVISDVVQGMIRWTGMYNLQGPSAGASASSVSDQAPGTSFDVEQNNRWWILSNSKWGIVENITGAKIHNVHLRDALVHFMATECGDKLMDKMDPAAWVTAMYGKGRLSPASIFDLDRPSTQVAAGLADPLDSELYWGLDSELSATVIPMPRGVKRMLEDRSSGSFARSLDWSATSFGGTQTNGYTRLTQSSGIQCATYLQLLVAGFRWESGHVYHQVLNGAVADVARGDTRPRLSEGQVIYNLLYGWNVRNADGRHLTEEEAETFIKNLILVHLIRNEMLIAPFSKFTAIKSSEQVTMESGEGHLRYTATKNKYSELYQWAMMIPHLQGVLLYYLAIGFPFACAMVLVPGWHKALFSWAGFWAWVKLWDLGFAMVMALERSVWAMLGNNAAIAQTFSRIVKMQDWGGVSVAACRNGGLCATTDVFVCGTGAVCSGTSGLLNLDDNWGWINSIRIFDRSMTLAANLDLDLTNSYYIYIMSALYMAVPMICGQLVLGGKAGLGNQLSGMLSGVGQEAGRQAAAGYQGDAVYRMKANEGSLEAAAKGKEMRKNGLIGNAIAAGNRQEQERANAGLFQARQSMVGNMASQAGNNFAAVDAAQKTIAPSLRAGGAIAGDLVKMMKGGAGGAVGAYGALKGRQAQVVADTDSELGRDAAPPPSDANKGGDKGVTGSKLGSGAPPATTSTDSGASRQATNAISNQASGPGRVSSNIGSTVGGLTNGAMSTGSQLLDLGFAGQNWAAKVANIDADAANQAMSARTTASAFGANQASTGWGQYEGRTFKQAGYEAEMGAWEARNSYGNQLAATSVALGANVGTFGGGMKPTDGMGMALDGQLGAETKASAEYFNPGGGFFSWASASQGELNANAAQVGNAYVGASLGYTLTDAAQTAFGEGNPLAVMGRDMAIMSGPNFTAGDTNRTLSPDQSGAANVNRAPILNSTGTQATHHVQSSEPLRQGVEALKDLPADAANSAADTVGIR